MEPMIGAWMYARPVSPTEDDSRPSDEKSLQDRIDSELRQRRSDRRERDAFPGGMPVWLMPIPPVPPEPMRPVAAHGGVLTEDDARKNARAPGADDAQRAGRHRRDNFDGAVRQAVVATQIALQRPVKTFADAREHPASQGVQDGAGHAAATAAADTRDIADAPSRKDAPSARDGIAPAAVRPHGARALPQPLADRPRESGLPSADGVSGPGETVATSGGSGRRPARHGPDDGETSGAPGQASGSHRPLQASTGTSQQAPPPRMPRPGAHAQTATAAERVPVRGDGMRYAFGSWGKGHFVNVQVVQVDGRSGFVLGASDAIVQRRLALALPASGDGGSPGASGETGSRGEVGLHIVEALPHSDDRRDEESGC
ncbi:MULTISPECIES: hypothetical protein [Pandoraea]|uniref:SpaN/EivJ family type III secretion system needle length determinant n=1 Tax=Pandoraea TaxID=93217 RepID=UPI001F5CD93F|nr:MULTISPECIES: hypothetical protein [Pandoraea]MCI3207295.1 hypothetical protein [Pandoraea sp. LA3]MDN4585324.1 hypothetical protein [Pandoraea capi]